MGRIAAVVVVLVLLGAIVVGIASYRVTDSPAWLAARRHLANHGGGDFVGAVERFEIVPSRYVVEDKRAFFEFEVFGNVPGTARVELDCSGDPSDAAAWKVVSASVGVVLQERCPACNFENRPGAIFCVWCREHLGGRVEIRRPVQGVAPRHSGN